MLLRSLPYWIVLILLLVAPPARSHGQDSPPAAVPKAASTGKAADDPAVVEAFKKAGRFRRCQLDKDCNVISVLLSGPPPLERPAERQLRLDCLENLKGFPRLRKIEVHTGNPNEALDYIADLTKLETLELNNTELIDSGLITIQGMTALKRLSLNSSYKVTDAGLEYLAGLKSLEDLDLSNTRIRGRGLSWLKGLKNLKKLDLSGNRIGDSEMVHVAAFAALEDLSLSCTDVTSRSIGELSRLTRLKALDLSGDGATRPGAEALMKSLPKLKIVLPSTGYARKPRTRYDP